MEFDLERIHSTLASAGKKLVYVIDELDKLTENNVFEILKYFKNLFTWSNALFIFVGGEELYEFGKITNESSSQIYRPPTYTYFTSRYFLQRPLWEDIDRYLSEIVEKIEGNKEEWEELKHILGFESNNDFFDLRACIKNRLSFDKEGRPILIISKFGTEDIIKARLHKAAMVIFKKYVYSNLLNWRDNEMLLRKLFGHCNSLAKADPNKQINDPTGGEPIDEMIRDFNFLLHRLKAFRLQNQTSQNIKGSTKTIRNYIYTGDLPSEPPPTLQDPTEFEKEFIETFEEFSEYMLAIINLYKEARNEDKISIRELLQNPPQIAALNNLGVNFSSHFNENLAVYRTLKENIQSSQYQRELVENKTSQLRNLIKTTFIGSLPNILARILQVYEKNLGLVNLAQNANLFSGSAVQIRNVLSNLNPVVVFKNDLSRQIVFILSNTEFIENSQIRRTIIENSQTHRIVIINPNKQIKRISGIHILRFRHPSELERKTRRLLNTLVKFIRT